MYHAHKTQRIFFIVWERPAPIEEFLLPPSGGVDWRVPDWLLSKFDFAKQARFVNTQSHFNPPDPNDNSVMVDTKGNPSLSGGTEFYNTLNPKDPSDRFDLIYHEFWKSFFVPSPPVAALIKSNLEALQLEPLHYNSVHIRGIYQKDGRQRKDEYVGYALNCVYNLLKRKRPNNNDTTTFYVASDSIDFAAAAVKLGQQKNWTITSRQYKEPPKHLDTETTNFLTWNQQQAANRPQVDAVFFYDTFVDLYLLSLGDCAVYGSGAYGLWANRISSSVSCAAEHSIRLSLSNLGDHCRTA